MHITVGAEALRATETFGTFLLIVARQVRGMKATTIALKVIQIDMGFQPIWYVFFERQ